MQTARVALGCSVHVQPSIGADRAWALLFNFPVGKQPGKGEDVWVDFGAVGWARLALQVVMRGVATYAAVEWRSADDEAPPQELVWSVFSVPQLGGTALA